MQTLAVYLGSSGKARPVFKEAAERLGRLIGERGKKLIYGGMDAGLMGIVAANALKAGAHVTGIIPKKIKDSERILPGVSETILVEDLCDRKKLMFLGADAIVTLPGGFGTLDETLEVLYWAHEKLHTKPLVLVNIEGYWDEMIDYIKGMPDYDSRFMLVVSTPEEVFAALESWEPPPPVETPPHLPHFEDEIMRDTAMPIIIDRASVENSYFMTCALGLKQLGKHRRGLGFLNKDGRFDNFLKWIYRAEKETFITPKCLELFSDDKDEEALRTKIKAQKDVHIDLHTDKWGKKES